MKTFFMQTKTYNLIALILGAMAFASCSKTDVPKLLEEGKTAFYAADYVKAKEAFEKCAKEDDSQGQFWLAYLTSYTHGHYSETDTLAMSQEEVAKYAFDLYKKSADQNDGDGYYGMAACFMTGYGVTKDESKFNECIDKSAELNSSFGKASKGKLLIQQGGANNIEKGIALIKESAEAGNYWGKTLLGTCYMDGTGVPADVNKGLGLLIESANHNDRDANSVLAHLYYFGMKSIPEDKVKAFKYAEKGASDGKTHLILCMCYLNGEGTKKDEGRAAYHARRSAEYGFARGQSIWASFCSLGYGTQEEAFNWYMKAAEQGDASSIAAVGMYYLTGTAGKIDFAMAKKYLQKAASKGVKTAQDLLSEYSLILSNY